MIHIVNAISVDIEDYFHTEAMSAAAPRKDWGLFATRIERNTHKVFDLLAEHNVRATFFFLGWVADRYPALIREAVTLGHEVGCHSYWHRPVFRLSRDEFRDDTLRAKCLLEDQAQRPVIGYRAPSFSITASAQWAYRVLSELRFVYDSSVNPVRHDIYSNRDALREPYRIEGTLMMEFPISTMEIWGQRIPAGGGAYLRILPYKCVELCVERTNRRENRPAILYFHPWEIDNQQPRLNVSSRSRFRQYTGLNRMEYKLRRLFRDFTFAPINEVFDKELSSLTTLRTLTESSETVSF